MRARYALVEALLKIKTFDAVRSAAEHLRDMLRLCCSDNLGVRDLLPALHLRLGKDQECYDFVKWWATYDPDGRYDMGNTNLPYLNIVDADAFESVEYLCGDFPDLSHLISVSLLKIKLLIDLKALQNSAFLTGTQPRELVDLVRHYIPLSDIVRKDSRLVSLANLADHIQKLSLQVDTLVEATAHVNEHFWAALIEPDTHLEAQPMS